MSNNLTYFGIKVGEWTPARECELNAREMRRAVSKFNDSFGTDDNHKYYILSGQAGYMLTRNIKDIRAQIEHDERLAKKELSIVSKRMARLQDMEFLRKHGRRL